ncbi:unnamed protein product [Gadus morhua 'NCC']
MGHFEESSTTALLNSTTWCGGVHYSIPSLCAPSPPSRLTAVCVGQRGTGLRGRGPRAEGAVKRCFCGAKAREVINVSRQRALPVVGRCLPWWRAALQAKSVRKDECVSCICSATAAVR